MRIAKIVAAFLATALLLPVGPAFAAGAPTPDLPDSREHGIVHWVGDGDTVDVTLSTGKIKRVRLLGIQAMEQYTYPRSNVGIKGECHAAQATLRLKQLIFEKEVRLSSFNPHITSRGREYRFISVKIDGVWRDVGGYLVSEGLALPMLNPTEFSYNWYYMAFSQWAAKRGIGLFDTNFCGEGPAADAQLKVDVKWDAPGNDRTNGNGEYMSITNNGSSSVDLSGWWVRDSGLQGWKGRHYTFPSGTEIPVNGTIRVHPDKGHHTKTDFYMGDHGPIFENLTTGKVFMGDGGYLFDPQGDLRAWQQYPIINVGDTAPAGETDPTNPDGTVNPITGLPYSFTDLLNGEVLVSDGITTIKLPADSLV